ncbi:CopD family protein [Ruegeria sp. HKCCD8929]|uniref:CopD family protein n=1 Tax=Ruegeria sp. HKCCD8929 TaxID=2683006 RepID=UPI00148A07DF|nr:CopD family protein [Ruegeria sp. HKCCD8929]
MDVWALSAIAVGFLFYASALLAMGLVVVGAFLGPFPAQVQAATTRQIAVCAVLALVLTALGFALRAAALTGDASGLTDPEMLMLLWQTPVGTELVLRVAGLALILIGLITGRGLDLIGAAILIAAFTQSGHVASADWSGLRVALGLHLAGIAFWIGVLPPLLRLAREDIYFEEAARVGHLFGQIAAVVVPLLLLAGLVMAWGLLGSLSALTSTYGLVLIGKLVLVSVLLGLGAANKLRFVPAMHRGERQAARHLARSVRLEMFVAAAVLLVTAILTGGPSLPEPV